MAKAKTKAALAKELGISRASLYYKPKQPATDEELKQKIISTILLASTIAPDEKKLKEII